MTAEVNSKLDEATKLQVEQMQAKMTETMTDLLKEANDTVGVLDEAGYAVFSISVSVDVPPRVSLYITRNSKKSASLSAEDVTKRTGLTFMQQWCLTTLAKIGEMDAQLAANKLELAGVSMTVSLPPSVTVTLKPIKDESAGAPASGKPGGVGCCVLM